MREHDKWHFDRLEKEVAAQKAATRANRAQILALLTLVASVVVPIIAR